MPSLKNPRLGNYSPATIVWFRNDLRLADNPALTAAVEGGGPVIPLFVWSPEEEEPWPPGEASRWWLHHSLLALRERLRERGSELVLRKGPAFGAIKALIRQTGAIRVFWNRRIEPTAIENDTKIIAALRNLDVEAKIFDASLLFPPDRIQTRTGRPFQVFTPFWRACLEHSPPDRPLPAPNSIAAPDPLCCTLPLEMLELLPRIDWASGMRDAWTPGERGANARLKQFLQEAIEAYAADRDRPDQTGTSRLSPHLHFGEISPRQVWHNVCTACGVPGAMPSETQTLPGVESFLRELGWREFAHHLLFHFPHTSEKPLREEFDAMQWRTDPIGLRLWQQGKTGFPIVDAGMRELWTTGWMHNRVRMIAASFLVKDLLIPWQQGAMWFWDTLVDADLASNTLGWQWTAGCGADAAPYFRVFNPVTQGEKFDPDGHYVRKWVPELRRLPAEWIHKPWAAPAGILQDAGVRIGHAYPEPIVDHAEARRRALAAFESIKASRPR